MPASSTSPTANAKDRMGHQIHQMYTARRIQRYEQLYGWRPLKFRIEAFVNGFVDLVRVGCLLPYLVPSLSSSSGITSDSEFLFHDCLALLLVNEHSLTF